MKITVIRFSSLGDCTLLCPFLDHLKQQGATQVTVVTKREFVELFSAATGVDRIVGLEKGGGWRALRQMASACGESDYLIDAHNTMRSRVVARALGGADVRFHKHYARKLGLIWLKRRVDLPPVSRSYSNLGEEIGFPPMERAAGGLSIPPAVRERVAEKMKHVKGPVIAMAPGSRWPAKEWGERRYFALAQRITGDYRYHVVLLGDSRDASITARIASGLGGNVTDLAGRASILETAAVIGRADAFIGNDSGLMHVAEAMGVPVIAIFGPTVEAFGYFPSLETSKVVERELACRPCSRNGSRVCPKGTHECMTGIDVDTVVAAFDDLVEGRGPARMLIN